MATQRKVLKLVTPEAARAVKQKLPPRYVGLDVHKRVVQACVMDGDGAVLQELRFDVSREGLTAFALNVLAPRDEVVVEASTNTWAVVRDIGAVIVVTRPKQC